MDQADSTLDPVALAQARALLRPVTRREPVVVPFELARDQIIIPVTLKGEQIKAVIDSGAPLSAIDVGYAHAHGIGPPGFAKFLPGSGKVNVNGAKVEDAIIRYEI